LLWATATVRPKQQLLEASVCFRILLFRRHGEAVDVRNDGRRPKLLHVIVVLPMVCHKSILVATQVVRIAWHNSDVDAVVVIRHVRERLLSAAMQVIVVKSVVAESQLCTSGSSTGRRRRWQLSHRLPLDLAQAQACVLISFRCWRAILAQSASLAQMVVCATSRLSSGMLKCD
jgi:hypothetical protein